MLHLTIETLLMKKIHLSIPRPCHENWEAMTPREKGKFCGSCQKTVVDFTNMSDRQIVEFFKKPPSSICGRAYNDQLNRDIVIPKKRIPWIKYFFQFTWPAFVLFLKSCGFKEDSKGKIKVESRSNLQLKDKPIGIVGMMMFPEITPVDTSVRIAEEEEMTKGEIMGGTVISEMPDTSQPIIDSLAEEEIVYKPMDTVVVSAFSNTSTGKIMLGGISVCGVESTEPPDDSSKKEIASTNENNFRVYPNPVRAGSQLTVSVEATDDIPDRIQILSSSGQLISEVRQNEKAAITNLQIPSNLTAGIYFLQMISKNKQVKTTKVLVTK